MSQLIVAVFLFLINTANVSAFDSSRKGFVIGGGAGHAVNSHWGKTETLINENKGGAGFNFLVGYGWDNRNMLVAEANATGYVSAAEWGKASFSGFSDQNVTQGFVGVGWYHYYPVSGIGELFTTTGLGFYSFNVQALDANTPGIGALVGVGFAYRRHFQLGIYLGGGRTSTSVESFKHSHVNILVTAIAF